MGKKQLKNRAKNIGILIITMIFLTSCSNQGNKHGLNPKKPQEIVVWHYYNGAQAVVFEEAVNEFNNTLGVEEGIIVSAESKSSVEDLIQAVLDSANRVVGAKEMPNIFQSYLDTAVQIDAMDLLVNLDNYIEEEVKNEYIDSYIEEGTFGTDEGWKLFPIAKSTEVLALNKTDWDKFANETGADITLLSTWEGITQIAEQYYTWSNGKSFFGRDAFANYMIIGAKQLGGELFEVHNGKAAVQVKEDVMRKLWNNFYVPYIKGYFKHVGRYRSDDVKIGEIICCVCATSGMPYFPKEVTIEDEEPYSIESIVLAVPNFEGTNACAVQQGASMAVTKGTETEEYASIVFLKWFTEEKRNLKFAIDAGYLPVKKEVNDYEKIEQYLIENQIEISQIQKDTLKVAVQQVKEGELYTTKGFEGGEETRNVVGSSMLQKAQNDREQIISKLENGETEKVILQSYLTEENFQQWSTQLQQQLETICQ